MDLEKILQHDICNCLMDHFTLKIIMTLNMVSKTFPDLTKHHKIKNIFHNDFSQDQYFFSKFSQNDKLISCIYEHKIIMSHNFTYKDVIYEMVSYYSRGNYYVEKSVLLSQKAS